VGSNDKVNAYHFSQHGTVIMNNDNNNSVNITTSVGNKWKKR